MNLVEIFSSVQGEGPHLGSSTLFVRLGGCDLRCAWCDTPHTWLAARECRIQHARGVEDWRVVENPLALETVLEAARALDVAAHRFVSLTGGEPLLQPDAVSALAPALRALGVRIHLETHGLAVEALERVIEHVDVVSMDWKLASDVRRESGEAGPFHAIHQRFLRVARRAPEVVVKLVVTPASGDEELEEAWSRIAAVGSPVTLVLQPVTPFARVRRAPDAARMLELAAQASRILDDVRVIPQMHRLLGAR
jgi:organic radical activating enzyme